MGVERNANDYTATRCHGIHERRITRFGIDELASGPALQCKLKAQGIEDFPKDDLIGRNAFALRDLLFEGMRIVARVSGDLGQRILNSPYCQRRRAKGIFIQRKARETGCRRRRQAGRRRADRRQREAAQRNATAQFASCHA